MIFPYDLIKKLCDEHDLAVTALEAKLGFGRGSIGKLRNGGSMTSERLQKVADYFGVTVEYLMTGVTPGYYTNPETAAIAQEIFEDKDRRLLFDASRNLTPEQIRLLYSMALSWQSEEGE